MNAGDSPPPPQPQLPLGRRRRRRCRDVFWLLLFLLHLLSFGLALAVLGLNRFRKPDRLNIDRFTNLTSPFAEPPSPYAPSPPSPLPCSAPRDLTESFWPFYGAAGAVGAVSAVVWLALSRRHAVPVMRFAVHSLTACLTVFGVLCFWGKHLFWGIALSVGAVLHLLYVVSVIDRFPFSMLVLQKAIHMIWGLPGVFTLASAFMVVMLCWMALWTFGVSGIVASSMHYGGQWWLLVVFSVSLFWTGAVLCNILHVVVSGMVFLVLIHGGQSCASMPQRPLLNSLQYAVTTSFGSICYGSLFTAIIRTLRWLIRGIRSKIGSNECLLCCVDFLFHIVETLVRFFNKYAYVQIAVDGKGFNLSARDAWELFQSTGIEALIAYDCSGAILFMSVILCGLITGTCAGVWTWFKRGDKVAMVGATAVLMGMILAEIVAVIIEGAVTSIYIAYAQDPSLIRQWDAELFDHMSEMLHQRLQYRSARVQKGLRSQLDRLPAASPV